MYKITTSRHTEWINKKIIQSMNGKKKNPKRNRSFFTYGTLNENFSYYCRFNFRPHEHTLPSNNTKTKPLKWSINNIQQK